jgi:hypothetical protein
MSDIPMIHGYEEQHSSEPIPIEHELKTWPVYFDAISFGGKRFEVRRDDRPFSTGDTVRLREWDEAKGYSGRQLMFRIGYVLRGFLPEHVVFALEPLTPVTHDPGDVRQVATSIAAAVDEYITSASEIDGWTLVGVEQAALDVLTAQPSEVEPKSWRCFHCDEVFTTKAEARDHFGPDAGFHFGQESPACIEKLTAGEKALVVEVREARAEAGRTAAENDLLGQQLAGFEASLRQRFNGAASVHDAFNLYDSMEGRALAAEVEVERLTAALEKSANNTDRAIEIIDDWKKLASQSAPSGWQQRIAAMDPWMATQYDDYRCFFCGAYREDEGEAQQKHPPQCLWQNAVDALPPAPEVRYADNFASCHHCGVISKQVICPRCGRERDSGILPLDSPLRTMKPDAKDAIPPVSEGATAHDDPPPLMQQLYDAIEEMPYADSIVCDAFPDRLIAIVEFHSRVSTGILPATPVCCCGGGFEVHCPVHDAEDASLVKEER